MSQVATSQKIEGNGGVISTREAILAGHSIFTLMGKGRKWTFRVRKGKDRPGYVRRWFVDLLTGPANEQDYQLIGWITEANEINKDKIEPLRAIRWVLQASDQAIADAGFEIVWSENCARCGRLLTVKSSVDGRLGPVCAKKVMEGV